MLTRKICPNCKGVNTAIPVGGGVTGSFSCSACGYMGNFIEQEVTGREYGDKNIEDEELVDKND